jgi:hypothetical protein
MRRLVSDKNNRKLPDSPRLFPDLMMPTVLPDGNGGFTSCPELLTEEELILFLRIPRISTAQDYRNVIENLKRIHGLPRIHICGKVLYPQEAVKEWIGSKTTNGK